MKKTRTLTLLAGIALFACCKKDEEQQPAGVAISGRWNKVSEYRTFTQGNTVTKDTIHYAIESNNWTFDTTAGKIYQVKNALYDTVYYKLIEDNKKLVTAVDGEFIFMLDTLKILQLDPYYLKLEGHYTTPYKQTSIINFAR